MNDSTLIDQIAKRVLAQIPKPIPITHQLWTHRDIAAYLNASVRTITDKTVKRPDFPVPIKPPLVKNASEGRPLYRASDVIAWAEADEKTRKKMVAA